MGAERMGRDLRGDEEKKVRMDKDENSKNRVI